MGWGRAGRLALRVALGVAGLVIAFVPALVAALALHINVPLLRRVVASRVHAALASSIRGELVIDSLGGIDFGGISEVNARVLDPEGRVVAAAYGVRARMTLGELVRSALGVGPLTLHLTEVTVRAVDFDVAIDSAGELGIQRAFAPRAPSREPPGRGVRLTIDRIDLAHAWVHGAPVPGLPIDADVDALRGTVQVDTSRAPLAVAVDLGSFALATRGMPFGANARGTSEAHLTLPAPKGGALGARVTWKGTVGGIAQTAEAALEGDAIEATLDAPEVTPDAVRALWPASPIRETAAVHADVRGALPRLDAHVSLKAAGASLDVAGPVVLGAGETAELHVDARAIDLHALVASLPPSLLTAAGDVSLARTPVGAVTVKGTIDSKEGRIAGAKIPSGKIRATFTQDPKTGARADATIAANEPGAPTVLSLRLRSKGRSYEVAFDGNTRVPALDAVPRLGTVARGKSELVTHGVVDFGRGELDVRVGAEIHDLGRDVVTVDHGSLDARVRGSLTAPQIDATLHGDVLDFGGYRFAKAELGVHGPAGNADLHVALDADGDGTPELAADGKLTLGSVTKIDQIRVHLARASERFAVHVGEVRIAHGEVSADEIRSSASRAPSTHRFTRRTPRPTSSCAARG